MVFSSLIFLYVFMPLCLLSYFWVKDRHSKNLVLIIFSLIFYAWGEPLFIFLFIFEALLNHFFALQMLRGRKNGGAKRALAIALVIDIGMLAVFKYSGFIVENLNVILPFELPVPNVKLPIGISFYTFQMISYMVDCYWESVKVQRNFFKFFMYVALFPQLVAGPIVRYSTIETEINTRVTTTQDIWEGIARIGVGLGKKVLIANNLSIITEAFFGGELSGLSTVGTWYGAAVYALQVYFDFSGYSDMAIGMGRIFGFHFDENFRHPFICKDITEFWQRWHISLGTFFRDYLLYIPIFGKRRKYGGLFLVWFCTGLWHGAAWNYIIWGLYFGVFILIELLIGKKKMKKIPIVVRHIYSKIILIIGFGIFYFEDVGRLGEFFKNLFGLNGNNFFDEFTRLSVTNNIFLLLAALLFCFPVGEFIKKRGENNFGVMKLVSVAEIPLTIALIVMSSIMITDSTNNPFLYFRF